MKNRGVVILLTLAFVVLGGALLCAAEDEHPEIPFEAQWASSGHADATAEAFIHWDEDDPPVVSTRCAECHAGAGYLDFLGVDGTEAGVVDNAPDPGVITCVTCHNEATIAMNSVVMPSGAELTGLGSEARCMLCHQGRESGVSVDAMIASAGVDDDTVSADLSFRNIHYAAAAVTQFGGLAMGGYQYQGKTYDVKFAHVEGFDTCIDCHDPHTLEVRVEECSVCHTDAVEVDDLKAARLEGSLANYDGDGDTSEGIYYQIEHLTKILYQAIQDYAAAAGIPTAYDAHAYPYWFTGTGERYGTWTPRLVRAAYNYQVSMKDTGAYAHGGKYIIQLLYDSIEDLDAGLAVGLQRDDPGHFAGSTEAWRHWDEDGEVQSSCAKCHSATGLPFYLEVGVNRAQPLSNGMLCSTCHDAVPGYSRYAVDQVEFPSGDVAGFGDGDGEDANLCLNCHQGRESTVSVDARIGDNPDDTVVEGLGFANVHYFAAGATLFGTEARGAYEYAGQSYNGRFGHVGSYDDCTECHDPHSLEVMTETCGTCHAGAADVADIRMGSTDFDGDGNTGEGIAGELETLGELLYAALQDYATNVVGTGIVYDSHRYPYWFTEDSARYGTWTPDLLRGAYNYQYLMKDPGAYAHNGKYIIQVLYDSLAGLGADVGGMVRP